MEKPSVESGWMSRSARADLENGYIPARLLTKYGFSINELCRIAGQGTRHHVERNGEVVMERFWAPKHLPKFTAAIRRKTNG